MANEYTVNAADLTTVADAIRAKTGTSEGLTFPDGFAAAIAGISTGAQVANGSVSLGRNERTVTVTPGFIVGKFMIVWATLTTGTTTKQAGAYYSGDSFNFYNTDGGIAYCTLITNTVESFSFQAPSTFTKGTYKWLATS